MLKNSSLALFFKGGLRLSVVGLGIGLLVTAAFHGILASRLTGVVANRVVVMTAITITVLIVASLATWLPAHKAATVDPLAALHVE